MPICSRHGNKSIRCLGTCPPEVRELVMRLRQLALDTAAELAEVGDVEETLKWGEPSYVSRTGSTIRLGW